MRALLAAAILSIAPAAWADAIDGAWCHDDLRLTINGPAIVTPGGTKMMGDYSRHAFSYVVPAGEPNAGRTVWMRLLSEEAMNLRVEPDVSWQPWRRCGPPIS